MSIRPNRMKDAKDLHYHDRWASHIFTSSKSGTIAENAQKSLVNWAFFKNKQWIFEEDLDKFLRGKETVRNRIRLTHNIIRPLVRRLVGNAIRNDFDFSVTSVSRRALNRMEDRLKRELTMTEIASESSFGDIIKQNNPLVGETKDETKQKFFASYTDEFASGIESLMENVSRRNDFDKIKRILAQNIVLSGIGIVYEKEHNGEQRFEVKRLHDFGWDTSAQEWDLSDAEFQYTVDYLSPVQIAESFSDEPGVTPAILAKLEEYARLQASSTFGMQGLGIVHRLAQEGAAERYPVVKAYWRDGEYVEYGVVKGKDEYEVYTKINHEDSDFTDADLVDSESYQSILKGRKKIRVYEDCIRFAYFIPNESFGDSLAGSLNASGKSTANLILKYGKRTYEEKDSFLRGEAKYPFKVFCWMHDNGEIISPIDTMIDPQRFINRMLSVTEHHVNSANPSGVVIDADSMVGDGVEEETREGIYNGEMIKLRTRGAGVNNVIGRYPSGVGDSAAGLLNLVQGLTNMTNDIAGNNEGISGTGSAVRASSMAVQNQVFQGTLMQEDLYFTLSRVFQQMYQSIATRGKKIYIDNQIELVKMVGDRYARHFTLTPEYYLEDFRSFVRRSSGEADNIQEGNKQLIEFFQLGLLSEKMLAEMWNKSKPRDIERGLVEYQVAKAEAAKLQQEQQSLVAEAQVAQQDAYAAKENAEAAAYRDAAQESNTVRLIDNATKLAAQPIRNQPR